MTNNELQAILERIADSLEDIADSLRGDTHISLNNIQYEQSQQLMNITTELSEFQTYLFRYLEDFIKLQEKTK